MKIIWYRGDTRSDWNSNGKLLYRGLLDDYFSLVVQFTFADMGAVAYMDLARSAIFAQRYFLRLIMRPSFCTPLLGMSPFGIWHITSIFSNQNNLSSIHCSLLLFVPLSTE